MTASLVLAGFATAAPSGSAGAAAPSPALHAQAHHSGPARRSGAMAAPRLAKPRATAPFRTFVVNTTGDYPLLNSASESCVDDQVSAHCSLRAAIDAADNLNRPVLIDLNPGTYDLTDTGDGSLFVTNAGGTTIVGKSSATTKIVSELGSGYEVFDVSGGMSDHGSTLQMQNVSVSGGNSEDGGGFYVYGATTSLVLDAVKVNGNDASQDGGGIYNYGASVWATNSSFSSNYAGSASYGGLGGGIYSYWGNLYLTDDTVDANIAGSTSENGDGGGLYVYYGTATLVGTAINSNTAGTASTMGDGGGIYDGDGTVDVSGSQINHDVAYGDGGATYEDSSHLQATNTEFEYDQANYGSEACGGAIYVDYYAQLELTGATFAHDSTSAGDTAGEGGGAIYDNFYELGDQLTVASSTFLSDNTVAVVLYGYYGGIDASFTNTTFQSDVASAEYAGGAILAYQDEYSDANLALAGDTFLHDSSTGSYGAGAVSLYAGEEGGVDATVSHCSFTSNVATGEYASGAFMQYAYYYSGSSVAISNSSFTTNKSTNEGYGGAVGSWTDDDYDGVQLVMDHDTITGNQAGSTVAGEEGDGGGIFAYEYTQLTLTNSTVSGNVADGGATSSGQGGGIYDLSYQGSLYSNDVITNNRAVGTDTYGGGIYIYPYYGGAILENSTVSGNKAIYGGGLFAEEYTMSVKNSTFSGNVAGSSAAAGLGGGIYAYELALQLSNSTITGNQAVNGGGQTGKGGGLYIQDNNDAAVTLYFDTVVGNAAAKAAGVFTTDDGYGAIRDSILSGNTTVLKGKVPADCFATGVANRLQSAGGNVLGSPACVGALNTGDVVSSAPGVSALANNGGPTETMALSPKSPAVGLAKGDCLATDQRGVARKAGHCDAGAFQLVVKGKPV